MQAREWLACVVIGLSALGGRGGDPNSATAHDWPQWRGPERTGVSHETGFTQAMAQRRPETPMEGDRLGRSSARNERGPVEGTVEPEGCSIQEYTTRPLWPSWA